MNNSNQLLPVSTNDVIAMNNDVVRIECNPVTSMVHRVKCLVFNMLSSTIFQTTRISSVSIHSFIRALTPSKMSLVLPSTEITNHFYGIMMKFSYTVDFPQTDQYIEMPYSQ